MRSDVDDVDDVVDELRVVRQGRGLLRSRLGPVIGPSLRKHLGLADDAEEQELRLILVDALIAAASHLPADERVAFLFGMAIRSDHRILSDRLAAAGNVYDRGERASRRRMDQAIEAVARELVQSGLRRRSQLLAPTDWTTLNLISTVDLRSPTPVVASEKMIMAARPLSRITEVVSLPRRPNSSDVAISVVSGGRVAELEQVRSSVWRYEIEFDVELRAGQTHQYEVRVAVSRPDALSPFNIMDPLRPCLSYTCIVHFAADKLPAAIERVDGLPASVLFDPFSPTAGMSPVERVQEEFSGLVPGLAYGLRWG